MLMNIILFILAAGLPFYLILEKNKNFNNEKIFLLSSLSLLSAILISVNISVDKFADIFVVIALINTIFTIYKATKTTNFHKLSYYLIFINAPFFVLFQEAQGAIYSLSLLVSLFGIYFIAKHYERHYGSANYHSITGTTLATPYLGAFLTVYLVSLAIYPPFPNSLLFFSSILKVEATFLWYAVVLVLFFGNFLLAMRVVSKTVFGKPNSHIHYVKLTVKERQIHFLILIVLAVLSIYGFQGAIS